MNPAYMLTMARPIASNLSAVPSDASPQPSPEAKLPKLDNGDINDHLNDWIITHALLNEAQALIEG
jgi:hypothetical protein